MPTTLLDIDGDSFKYVLSYVGSITDIVSLGMTSKSLFKIMASSLSVLYLDSSIIPKGIGLDDMSDSSSATNRSTSRDTMNILAAWLLSGNCIIQDVHLCLEHLSISAQIELVPLLLPLLSKAMRRGVFTNLLRFHLTFNQEDSTEVEHAEVMPGLVSSRWWLGVLHECNLTFLDEFRVYLIGDGTQPGRSCVHIKEIVMSLLPTTPSQTISRLERRDIDVSERLVCKYERIITELPIRCPALTHLCGRGFTDAFALKIEGCYNPDCDYYPERQRIGGLGIWPSLKTLDLGELINQILVNQMQDLEVHERVVFFSRWVNDDEYEEDDIKRKSLYDLWFEESEQNGDEGFDIHCVIWILFIRIDLATTFPSVTDIRLLTDSHMTLLYIFNNLIEFTIKNEEMEKPSFLDQVLYLEVGVAEGDDLALEIEFLWSEMIRLYARERSLAGSGRDAGAGLRRNTAGAFFPSTHIVFTSLRGLWLHGCLPSPYIIDMVRTTEKKRLEPSDEERKHLEYFELVNGGGTAIDISLYSWLDFSKNLSVWRYVSRFGLECSDIAEDAKELYLPLSIPGVSRLRVFNEDQERDPHWAVPYWDWSAGEIQISEAALERMPDEYDAPLEFM